MTTAGAGGQQDAIKSPRWLKLALIASLAVNLLVVGTIGGSIWAFRHGEHGLGRGVSSHLRGFTGTLGMERRYAVWQATRQERQALRPLRKEVRKARAEARVLLAAQPFDRQKFADAQARVLAAEVKAREETHKLFIAVAAALTPAERAAFANWQPPRAERMRRDRLNDAQPPAATAQPR